MPPAAEIRPPTIADAAGLDPVPDSPGVFLLWAATGAPYLAKTARLRRRLRRLLGRGDRISSVLRLGGVIERIEYWTTGSQLESMLLHLALAKRHFPDDWQKITRFRPPVMLRLTTYNQFPRTMITTRLGRGVYYGPFPSRAAAERFDAQLLDLFQLRRCEENLAPAPEHPGCIYGEMNRCLRPCQQAVSEDEYRHESARVQQFLQTGCASLTNAAEAARDRASSEMQFEDAERWHQRLTKIGETRASSGDLARTVDRLAGVAIVPSSSPGSVELMFLAAGCWQPPVRFAVATVLPAAQSDAATAATDPATQNQSSELASEPASEQSAGQSMDRRLRELLATLDPQGEPNLEHLAVLVRWQGSSWRDGEWIGFETYDKLPYRKIVNAIGRVAAQFPQRLEQAQHP